MSERKKRILEFIEGLGDEAPAYFGKNPATVRLWLKTGNIPFDVADKVLEELDATAGAAGSFDQECSDATETPPQEAPAYQPGFEQEVSRVIGELIVAMEGLARRLNYLEGNGPANAPQIAPPPALRGQGVQWAEPAPRDSNVGSMVRPMGTTLGTISAPAPQQNNGPKPSDSWLKPRPLRTVVAGA